MSDPHAELDGRMGNFGGLNRDTMQSLQMMLHACNPYANIYQTTAEWLQGGVVELSLRLVNDRRTNLQCYNAPTVDKVGALVVGGDVDEVDARDIVVRSTNGYFQRISPLHSAYAPLHYILFFPDGHNRWHDDIPLNGFQWDGFGFIQDICIPGSCTARHVTDGVLSCILKEKRHHDASKAKTYVLQGML